MNGVSPGPQGLALFSAHEEMSHNEHTDDDLAQQGQHCLEESPKNQIHLPQVIHLL